MRLVVVIPTYNNATTLGDVVRRVYAQWPDIIVVSDGSTDNTLEVLASLDVPFTLVSYAKNKGKGHALREGFRKARELGFTHALTIDSDGQHFPEDIPLLKHAACVRPDAIIIGSRELKQANMPGKNTFANKFSNFWFALQTGFHLPDTQTGLRVYPLERIRGERILTSRYEAELELLVFSAWANVSVVPVSVRVYYPPKEERVSHFRPAYDFTRISILNTILCVLAVVYGYPRRYWRTFYYYTLFFLDMVLVVWPALCWLRVRYGDSSAMRTHLQSFVQRNTRWFLSACPGIPYRVACQSETLTPLAFSQRPQTPAVYIANHSSLLDVLILYSLCGKVCIVAKDWVGKNPLFGRVARALGILQASEGIESILPEAQRMIDEGYSLAIFPEGTRTMTGDLQRFHRGAFYLSEQLGLPLRPFFIRGTFELLNKPFVRIGSPTAITVHALPDILPSGDYRSQTRAVSSLYHQYMEQLF